MKKSLSLLMALTFLLTSCGAAHEESSPENTADSTTTSSSAESTETTKATAAQSDTAAQTTTTVSAKAPLPDPTVSDASEVVYLARPSLLSGYSAASIKVDKPVTYLEPDSTLSNVYFGGYDYLLESPSECLDLLKKNGFYLQESYTNEYFELYETNRYSNLANYVTVDSMMHTYHLYFAHLLKKIESEHLAGDLQTVSLQMLQNAQAQYDQLKGTEWEAAAKAELAFFAIGAALQDPDTAIPDAVSKEVNAELAAINDAAGIADSNVFEEVTEDYSQYKPRGYYDSSEKLQRYFRAMMWYGRMGFRQDKETLNRAALLVTLALDGDALDAWSRIYAVTAFFAGASDDIGYYELRPLIDAVYGKDATLDTIVQNPERWTVFNDLSKKLPAPAINAVPVLDSASDEEHDAAQKGFRFMGQRFSIDEAAFTQLVYRQVKENASGVKRMLPDMLDFAAALGSETAHDILKDSGKTDYPNYEEQLEKVRKATNAATENAWNTSLYSSWIYTLTPELETKDETYPPFMRTDAWRRKSLLSFAGSYTELKHDTVLYSKQMMGEMGGGGPIPDYDDRGYVEAEPVIFERLRALVSATSEGLAGFGMIDSADTENLRILTELSGKLKTIAQKELNGELPTDEEFELIKTIGGQIEHFWEEVMDAEFPDETYHNPQLHPAAIVADIATDPNGSCLEVGTGNPMEITVIVQVDGKLKIASGPIYSFYQFEQPLSERLTDADWRVKLGISPKDEDSYPEADKNLKKPYWYTDLMYVYQ